MDLSSPANLLISGIYYVIVGIMTIFSVFGIYILIKRGESKIFSFSIALFYGFIFFVILLQTYGTLRKIIGT